MTRLPRPLTVLALVLLSCAPSTPNEPQQDDPVAEPEGVDGAEAVTDEDDDEPAHAVAIGAPQPPDAGVNPNDAGDGAPPPSVPSHVFTLPGACGSVVRFGNANGVGSHRGLGYYGYDLAFAMNAPLHAMRSGVVAKLQNTTKPGDPCYRGGPKSCWTKANYVLLRHDDASFTLYMHLNAVSVVVGQTVQRGQQLGLVGSTGWSTGAHAHVQRQKACSSWFCQTLPLPFHELPGNGIATRGVSAVSKSCQ